MGADRPGIVAAVTGVLVEQGCNLEDSSMTILRGHFAMMLVVDTPPGLTPADLEAALGRPAAALDLIVTVRPIDEAVVASPEGEAWMVSVYGADRPGIVHGVASRLADAGVNIVDLTTRVIGDPSQPVYAMLLEVTVPPGVDPDALADELKALAAELHVDTSMHRADADIL
ncbi:MAG: ACT domain-containing protein [Actinomycetota bacterium]|nr:ACT domain-containing protein [Actinomycetota bacterium]